MSLNMKTLTQALAKTAAVIEKTVSSTVQEVTGPRPLTDYDLLDNCCSGGPALAWRIYTARPRSSAPSAPYPLVSVWVLDKRALSESRARAGLSKAVEDAFLDLIRADAARMVRLRHPGVLHVVQALDETKNAIAMVTEPVFASASNVLGNLENVTDPPKELKGIEMGLLEIKHGLLQVAETLDFLHNNAHLIHRSISPESVFITLSGAWKLGGFGFTISADQASGASVSVQQFHYSDYDAEDAVLPLQPSLNYTAPELVRNGGSAVTYACDMFSFGCLAYHLISHRPLLDCHSNVKMYMNSLTYLTSEAFSSIPPELVMELQRMLSTNEASRPSAMDFTGSSFFRNDTRLRALRFLDHMLERDNMQKTEFLKALSDMWKDFDSRVLRSKVLSPLCAELRNVVMQPMILPMVLTIAESQDKNDFEISTLPALVPVFGSASGETLLLLVKNADMIINKATHEHLIAHILPMLVHAYDDTDPRIQEEVLRKTVSLAKKLDSQLLKQYIVPRVHSSALKTTVAGVRVNALRCLGELVSSLDKIAILEILQTLRRCTAVDHSAPTLMCTLGVANAILKQCGIEFAAEHVVPLIFPLLTAQQLNVQQFAKYLLFVKDIVRKIEEKRGVAITDGVNSEINIPSAGVNGHHQASVQGLSAERKSSSASWDEDWPASTKKTASASQSLKSSLEVKPTIIPSTAVQASGSCAPVDVEWPPKNISSGVLQANASVDQKTSGLSDNTFDDIDPFADWPPRPTNFVSYGNDMKPNPDPSLGSRIFDLPGTNFLSGPSKPHQGNLFSADSSKNVLAGDSVGHASQNFGLGVGYSTPNTLYPSIASSAPSQLSGQVQSDFGAIFASTSNANPTPRIAPPPTTAIGRGRGRNHGQSALSKASQPTKPKASSDQPLFDLLQ